MATLLDLADTIAQGFRIRTTTGTTLDFSFLLASIRRKADKFPFQNLHLRKDILFCVDMIAPQLQKLNDLPLILTHQDLSPFNYLIDEVTGQICAIIDWENARYNILGLNFHFICELFGCMTKRGWIDHEKRDDLEAAFYARLFDNLAAQGFHDVTREHIELSTAVGMLQHHLEVGSRFPSDRSEKYMEAHLRRLSFMNDSTDIFRPEASNT